MKTIFRILPIFFLISIFSCSDQDDDIFVPDPNLEVQDFIWKGLNLYYYWQDDVADLQDDRFTSQDAYQEFLGGYPNPEDLFDHLLSPEDRFSFITDDYIELQDAREGNFDSNGMAFGLIGYNDSNKVNGYVRYVLPGSDAEQKGITRGDLFTGVNGTPLNRDNYFDLLFGPDSRQYILDMGAYNTANEIVANGETVTLVKTPTTENPVFITKTISLANGVTAGYLMYNRFTASFDRELNAAFGDLKSQGATELILDLRYNPGGSVNTSANLASMITGQFDNQLFTKLRYNSKIEATLSDAATNYNFRNTLSGQAINSLMLTRLYVITTARTASASELIINGLDPYIEVIQVGDVTTGKNEASITLYDSPSFRFNDEGLNPNHTWAMQPLVSKNENSIGFSDYTSGFTPEAPLKEDFRNLGVLGSTTEPLLAKALQQIDPSIQAKSPYPTPLGAEELFGSEWHPLLKNDMYLDPGH
ncbi:S41 family peptidase [Robertkochia sediminum]|uniref:S41 family peptidase n=1 Tax=Robertkochia sediminum TaxID=2785326 RepID=UPI001932600B|nr:S41 family peptidase [Robertkochia sediminum]MBL7473144.1 hypothetical protein [Robertkochia sediminum]